LVQPAGLTLAARSRSAREALEAARLEYRALRDAPATEVRSLRREHSAFTISSSRARCWHREVQLQPWSFRQDDWLRAAAVVPTRPRPRYRAHRPHRLGREHSWGAPLQGKIRRYWWPNASWKS